MNKFQTEAKLVISGSHLGIVKVPLANFTEVIPAVIARKTKANATASADVNLKESVHKLNQMNTRLSLHIHIFSIWF